MRLKKNVGNKNFYIYIKIILSKRFDHNLNDVSGIYVRKVTKSSKFCARNFETYFRYFRADCHTHVLLRNVGNCLCRAPL